MHIWISAFKKGDVIMKKWVKKLSALIIITAIIATNVLVCYAQEYEDGSYQEENAQDGSEELNEDVSPDVEMEIEKEEEEPEVIAEEPVEEPEVIVEEPQENEELDQELKENSWRYTDGILTVDEPAMFAGSRSSFIPWTKVDGSYVNSFGEVIPNAVARGIDVSEHQGTIDWNQVKNADVGFAIIRCGYGSNMTSQDDKQWLRNVSECERLGIPYGVYLYSYATTTEQARSEAEHVLRLISGHNLSYPIFYDLEDSNTTGKLSNAQILSLTKTFCSTITNAGYSVGVYANTYWLYLYLCHF